MKLLKRTELDIEAWNRVFPIGHPATYRRDDGTMLHTKIRSKAWLIAGYFGIVLIDGITGGVSIDRISTDYSQDSNNEEKATQPS